MVPGSQAGPGPSPMANMKTPPSDHSRGPYGAQQSQENQFNKLRSAMIDPKELQQIWGMLR
jgi:hypothetical protein